MSLADLTLDATLQSRVVWQSKTDQWNGALPGRSSRLINVQSDVLCFALPDLGNANEYAPGTYCQSLLSDSAVVQKVGSGFSNAFLWVSVGGNLLCQLSSRSKLSCGMPQVNTHQT